MKLNGFDANNFEPQRSFEPLPVGSYTAVISDSEERQNRAGTGSYLSLTFEIVEGDHKGRKVFDNLNIRHPNRTAVEIANRKLSTICRAVGNMNPADTSELHNCPMKINVGTRKRDDNGETVNTVKNFMPVSQPPQASGGSWASSEEAPF